MKPDAHSHYHPATKTWFTPTECGNCGSTIQEPNSVKLLSAAACDRARVRAGLPMLVRVTVLPGEGYYDERTESEESCDNCAGRAA